MLELRAASLADTHAIAGALADVSRPGDLIVLSGEMGAGKTAFAKGFGGALGVTEPITSPTFTLVHTYDIAAGLGRGAEALHHADLYRLDRTAEIADLALEELAEYQGIVLVEWGDVVEGIFVHRCLPGGVVGGVGFGRARFGLLPDPAAHLGGWPGRPLDKAFGGVASVTSISVLAAQSLWVL